MRLLNKIGAPAIIMPTEKAEHIADMLNNDDEDGWNYEVFTVKEGLSKIAVYDDDDIFISFFEQY